MRVVDVTSFFAESCGGIKTYYREKARHLPALGVDCHFIVPGKQSGATPFAGGILHRLAGPPLPGNAQYRLFGSGQELASLLRRLAPDVIEVGSHTFLPGMIEDAVDAAGGRRPALVGFFHSDVARTLVEPLVDWMPAAVARGAVAAAWRFVRRQHTRYQATLVASRAVEIALRDKGVPRVHWVGLGVDIDVFRPAAAEASHRASTARPTLLYAGRLSPDKNTGLLLAAIDRIHDATGAGLRLVGDGPSRAVAERFAHSRPFVSVEGYVDQPARLAEIIASADALVTPGARETFSLSTAEALACGTPVIAPDEGGAHELVAASTGGVLFRTGSAQGLAQAAIELLARPLHERKMMGARGRAHVAGHLTWPAVAHRLLEAYGTAAQGPRA